MGPTLQSSPCEASWAEVAEEQVWEEAFHWIMFYKPCILNQVQVALCVELSNKKKKKLKTLQNLDFSSQYP